MTVMLPKKAFVSDSVSKSEIQFFSIIEKSFKNKSSYCIHQLEVENHKFKEWTSNDFLFVFERGIFALELKGGTVERVNNEWFYIRDGKKKKGESPLNQVKGTHVEIKNFINEKFPEHKNKFLIGYGVIIPDMIFDCNDLEFDSQLICDERKKYKFEDFINDLAEYFYQKKKEQKQEKYKKIESNLRTKIIKSFCPDIFFKTNKKKTVDEELIFFSEEQCNILNKLKDFSKKRLLCKGDAGTGKTVIAKVAAERVAKDKKILFLCFNTLLAENIGKYFTNNNFLNVDVFTISRFFNELQKKAGLNPVEFDDEKYFNYVSNSCEKNFDNEDKKYDYLVLDEAQDFMINDYFAVLDQCLKRGLKDGNWLIMYDPEEQSGMYNRYDEKLITELESYSFPWQLEHNYRNPNAIVETINEKFKKNIVPKNFKDVILYNLEYSSYSEKLAGIGKILNILFKQFSQDDSDITILSLTSLNNSFLNNLEQSTFEENNMLLKKGKKNFVLEFEFNGLKKNIIIHSVFRYKGLENYSIILIDDHLQKNRSAEYVGYTRSLLYLFVLKNRIKNK